MIRCSRRRERLAHLLLALSLLFGLTACSRGEKTWFLIQQDGTPVGYQVVTVHPGDPEKDRPSRTQLKMLLRSTLLGGAFDIRVNEERELDPVTGRPRWIEGKMTAGDLRVEAVTVFAGDSAHYTPRSGGAPFALACGPDVMIPDPLSYSFLLEDSVASTGKPHPYRLFDAALGRILDCRFMLRGEETLGVAGSDWICLVFDQEIESAGTNQRFWIDRASGELVQSLTPDGFTMVRSRSDAARGVERWNMDEEIFTPVDLDLENYRDISYMQVRARIRSQGRKLTPSGLNVPGQGFEGSVDGNLIDGVFTIEHGRYDGENAPPFPADWEEREDLTRFLEPEILVESEDPVLIAEARTIAEGAANSWEAVLRLSTWVSSEIRPAVPGASARGTYDTRRGECAGHARLLTAFCRGVGIPSRIVSGCMYTPVRGGSFGQHVWNEVYMGETVGWVPIDSAVEEPGFIDSGHIRLGGMVSFRPEEMEILDYRLEADGDTLSKTGG